MAGGTGAIIEYHGPGVDSISCTGNISFCLILLLYTVYINQEWVLSVTWVLKLVPPLHYFHTTTEWLHTSMLQIDRVCMLCVFVVLCMVWYGVFLAAYSAGVTFVCSYGVFSQASVC